MVIKEIEEKFKYPFIAKPVDDGCSSAVKKIDNQRELIAYSEMIFRDNPELPSISSNLFKMDQKEEIPKKIINLI